MNELEPQDDERRLQALFDQTAPAPEPDVLQRMARAAARIPESSVPWYRKLWLTRPWAVGMLATAAALTLIVGISLDDEATRRDPGAVAASAPAEVPSASEDGLDELLAFEVTDDLDGDVAALDADPLSAWVDGDEVMLASDSPLEALDLLFFDTLDDVDTLGHAFDDVLAEGG